MGRCQEQDPQMEAAPMQPPPRLTASVSSCEEWGRHSHSQGCLRVKQQDAHRGCFPAGGMFSAERVRRTFAPACGEGWGGVGSSLEQPLQTAHLG